MPKIIFKTMSLDDNVNFIKEIFFEEDSTLNVHNYTISLFPELGELSLNNSREMVDEKIREVVSKYYNNYDLFDDDIKRYSDSWNKYNNLFFEKLTKYLNINWPLNHDIIYANVGIIPVCPRYLDNFSFSLHEGISNEKLIETCAHELCHFLWFEKWKELFPKYKREEFEAPSLIWEYSEMVVNPILNSDELSNVFDGKQTRYCYDYFYDDNDYRIIMDKLFDIYNENISIEEKIIKGYDYIMKKVPR